MNNFSSSVKSRTRPASGSDRIKMLDAINSNLHEYSTRKISIKECLLKTGQLSTDLIVYHYSDVKFPKKTHSMIAMMITNYYVILHIDMYTGFYTVNKDYIYNMAVKLSDEILNQSMAIHRLNSDERESLEVQSGNFLRKQVETIYRTGIEGCVSHLTSSIYNEMVSADKSTFLSEEKIEDVIRSVQSINSFGSK